MNDGKYYVIYYDHYFDSSSCELEELKTKKEVSDFCLSKEHDEHTKFFIFQGKQLFLQIKETKIIESYDVTERL